MELAAGHALVAFRDWCGVLRRRRGSRWCAHGVPQLRNMRREYITIEELEEKLREQGIEHMSDVKAAYLEGDGQISIIKREAGDEPRARRKTAIAGGR